MPKNADPLPPAEVEMIKKWIAEGAKDDTPANVRDPIDADHPPVYELPPVITSVDFSPDGTLLAVAGYHEVLLHKADGSGLVGRLVGLSERIQSLAFSPDGKLPGRGRRLAGPLRRSCRSGTWPRKKLKLSQSITFDTLYGVSWSHDGTKIAFGCADNTLRAIDADHRQADPLPGRRTTTGCSAPSSPRTRTFLASVSRDGSMKLTEVATQRFIDNITSITPGALKGGLLAVARNPVKREQKVKVHAAGIDKSDRWYDELLIGGSDGVPRLYKMHRETEARHRRRRQQGPRVRRRCRAASIALAFNKDGSQFAAGSSLDGTGEVRVYQTADGKHRVEVRGPAGAGVHAWPSARTARRIASAGFDGTVRLIDPATGKLIKEFMPVPLKAPTAQAKTP